MSGPFSIYCVVHVDFILLNARTSARRAPTFFVYADFVSIVCMRTYSSHTRTVFIYQHPEWTFLVTRASGADHSLREWIFFYCLRVARIQYSIKRTRPPRADLFRSRGPLIYYVRTLSRAGLTSMPIMPWHGAPALGGPPRPKYIFSQAILCCAPSLFVSFDD